MGYTYDYLKSNAPTERIGRGLDILEPKHMQQVQIGDIIDVWRNYNDYVGTAYVIKALDIEVEVAISGLFMVFNLDDTAEWNEAGYEFITA